MTARWWAPVEAGIGPDATDLFLLGSDGDPTRDLGQVLLGLHRVGAAACEAVATQPLSDEGTLRMVLAKARELTVPEALGTVSKAVGDANYGGLLLRDVLDDAEAAAVSLYRSCLARGVTPTLAAQRVGKVYGTPIHELGRYTALATDPKAQLVALDDAADRALMGFVAKVVAEEATETKVTFSKAPGEEYLERHNEAQDARGRFVRLREQVLPGKTLDEMLAPPQETVGPAKVGRRTAQGARLAQRGRKAVRARVAGPEQAQERGGQARAGQSRGAQDRRTQTREGQVRQRAYLASNTEVEPGKLIVAGAREVPDPLSRRPEMDGVHNLGTSVAFSLPAEEWSEFKAKSAGAEVQVAGGVRNVRVFRAGALAEYSGDPELFDTSDLDHPDHDAVATARADALYARDQAEGIADYEIHTLDNSAMAGMSEPQMAAYLDNAKLEFLKGLQRRTGVLLNLSREKDFVTAVDDYDDESLTVLVYTPPSEGRSAYNRPVRGVYDIVVPQTSAYGVDDAAGTSHHHFKIDPNLPLMVDTSSEEDISRYFKREGKGGYFRTEVYLRSSTDDVLDNAARKRDRGPAFGPKDVGKAEGHLERQREFQRNMLAGLIHRDPETGEFAEAETAETGAEAVTEQPQARQAAQARKAVRGRTVQRGRVLPQAELPTSQRRAQLRPGQTRAGQERPGMSREAQAQAATLTVAHLSQQGTYLDHSYEYSVLNWDEQKMLRRQLTHRDRTPVIDFDMAHRLNRDTRILRVPDTASALIDEQNKEWLALPMTGGTWAPIAGNSTFTVRRIDDLSAIALQLEDYLGKNPQVGMLRSVMVSDEDGWTIRVERNSHEMPPLQLVRYEHGFGDGVLELHDEGETRLVNARSLEAWLRMRFHGIAQGGNFGVGGQDMFPVPVVQTWSATVKDEP